MKGEFDEAGIFWEEIEPTFFDKVKIFFGFPQPPRGYIPHRPRGMSGWCGNALGLVEREKMELDEAYPQVLKILEAKRYITEKLLIDDLNTSVIVAGDIMLKLKAEGRITNDGLKAFDR